MASFIDQLKQGEVKGATFLNVTTAIVWVMALIEFVNAGYKAPGWFVGGWDSVFGLTLITYGTTTTWRAIKTAKAELTGG